MPLVRFEPKRFRYRHAFLMHELENEKFVVDLVAFPEVELRRSSTRMTMEREPCTSSWRSTIRVRFENPPTSTGFQ